VDATGGNTFSLSGYDGVKWGIWENVDPLNGPSAFYDVDGELFNDFEFIPWLVVPALDPDTEITDYTGQVNYGFTRAHNSYNSWGGTLSALNVSMNINFGLGTIAAGTINLCFGGSGCGSATESWHGHFGSGTLGADMSLPIMAVTGNISDPVNGSFYDSFFGDISGFLTGYNANQPYDALAGGFNLTTGVGERSVAGTFLNEIESRLTASNMEILDGFYRGAFMKPDGTVVTGLAGLHTTSDTLAGVYFVDESTTNNTVWKFGNYNGPNMIQWNGFGDANSNSLQFGLLEGTATAQTDNINDSLFTSITGLIPWINYAPSDFSGINVIRFAPDSSYIYGDITFESSTAGWSPIASSNNPGNFDLAFGVDPSTGSVLGQRMSLTKLQTVNGNPYYFIWEFELNPNNNVVDGVAMFNIADYDSATLTVRDGSMNFVTSSNVTTAILSGSISSDRADAWNQSYIGGSTLLRGSVTVEGFDIDVQVLGDFEVYGYFDEQLTRTELNAMEDNLGIVVRRGTNAVSDFHLTTGNNSDMKLSQTTITVSNIADELITEGIVFNSQPESVLTEETTTVGATNSTPGFNVGWGAWASTLKTDHKGATTSNYFSEAVYWLSAEKADLADLTGEWSYSNVVDFEGEGTGGSLSSLDMSFDVNFGSGNINNGLFRAVVGGNTWDAGFTGTVHGATANINDFSGSTFGTDPDPVNNASTTVSGDIRGIFTGTGTNQGFATGFSLTETGGAFVNGVGLLGTRVSNEL